jgi:D-alanyl-D-alanine carboxypeptidase
MFRSLSILFALPRRRVAAHALALVAVTSLVLVSAFAPSHQTEAQPAPPTDQAADIGPSTPAWLQPAQVSLDFPDTAPVAAAPRRPALNPTLALPLWVRTTQDTTLWSASDASNGVALGSLPSSGYLKPLGQFTDGRLQVYFPGDGVRASTQAWVDVQDLEPSSTPAWIAPSTASTALTAAPRRLPDVAPAHVTASHVAIIDDASGQMIYGEAPDTRVAQASTTKIATTIVALERTTNLQQKIKVSVSASAMVAADGSSTMGLEPGEQISLETLLYGMMLPSGNDAAEQVAVSLGGSRSTYVGWMNQEAEALGLKNTHFVNPSGMDADGHYSSAYDMAMLGRYAMSNPEFRILAGTVRWSGDGYPMKNLNRLLGVYPGVDGVKIGETDNAGKTIVASAVHDGHRLYIGLMHSSDLAGDCTALFDWAWDAFAW